MPLTPYRILKPNLYEAGCVLLVSDDYVEGSTLKDLSGFKNNGTIYGAVRKKGVCLNFDGSDDYVKVDNLNFNSSFTWEVWIRPNFNYNDNTEHYILHFYVDSSNYIILTKTSTNYINFTIYWGGGASFSTIKAFNSGELHHLVVKYDNDKKIMYIYWDCDESSYTPASVKAPTGTGSLYIGSNNALSSFWNGSIFEVRCYNRALTPLEIKRNYYGDVTTNGLVLWLKFNEGNGNTVLDSSGNGNNGTIYGATWSVESKGLYFDGVDDWVDCGSGDGFDSISGELTVEAVVKEKQRGEVVKVVSRRSATEIKKFWFLGVDSGKPYGGIGDGTNTKVTAKSFTMPLNEEHRLAFVFKDVDDKGYIYYDGDLKETSSIPYSIPSLEGIKVSIGADKEGTDKYFKGLVREVLVYNKLFSLSKIFAHQRNSRFLPDRVLI